MRPRHEMPSGIRQLSASTTLSMGEQFSNETKKAISRKCSAILKKNERGTQKMNEQDNIQQLEKQIAAKKEKMAKAEAKAKIAKAELRKVEARLNESKRKARTRYLIQIGAEAISRTGELDLEKWKSYLDDYAPAIRKKCAKEETPDQDTMHPYQAPDEQQPEYRAQSDSSFNSTFFN